MPDKIGKMWAREMEGKRERAGEKWSTEKNLREWDSRDGGRTEIRARKDISLLRVLLKG